MLKKHLLGLPCGSDGKESSCNVGGARDVGSIPCRSGRYPVEGNGNPLQYSCLENYMDRGAWWVTIHGVAKSYTRLSGCHTTDYHTFTKKHLPVHNSVYLILWNITIAGKTFQMSQSSTTFSGCQWIPGCGWEGLEISGISFQKQEVCCPLLASQRGNLIFHIYLDIMRLW